MTVRMDSNAGSILIRHKMEERLRQIIYTIIDTAHDLNADSEERKLWGVIHDDICRIAEYYESKGLKVWKH